MPGPLARGLPALAIAILAVGVAAAVYERGFYRSLFAAGITTAAGPLALVVGGVAVSRSRTALGRATAAVAIVLAALLTAFVAWIVWFGLTRAS